MDDKYYFREDFPLIGIEKAKSETEVKEGKDTKVEKVEVKVSDEYRENFIF